MDSKLYINETIAYNVQTDGSQVSTRAPSETGSAPSYHPSTQPRQHNWSESPLTGLSEAPRDNQPSAQMHSTTPPTHWTVPPPDTMNQVPPTSPHSPPPQMNFQPSPPSYSDANNAFLYPQSPPPPQNDSTGPPQYPGPPAGGITYYT